MAATRFMRDLEIRLVEGENSAAVDLFDPLHARRVLTAYGRAYGVLPEKTSELTSEQRAFLEQSVAGLAQDGKVISVRLALFAEMVKGKPWTPATLKEVGGTQGVGVTFLEETFGASTAPPEHRLHQKAAQAVLKALLPRSGTDIKGQMRSESELREASGYASRPRDFDDVIAILDHDLRLITPTDPEGSAGEGEPAQPDGRRYYQLTHDYLVPSLRDWLTRKQRATRRGRAELRLADRAAIWETKPENRHLPSVSEWVTIRTLSRPKDWTDPQRRMMHRAGRVHGLRLLGLAALVALLSWGGLEVSGNIQATHWVETLKTANTAEVPAILEKIAGYRRWADSPLRSLVQNAQDSSREKLHASLALLPMDRSQLSFLEQRLLKASATELPVLRTLLKGHSDELCRHLWTALEAAKPLDDRLLPAASALADYDRENPRWADLGGKVAQALVSVNAVDLRPWLEALRPVRGKLITPLSAVFRDRQASETVHSLATDILSDYAHDDPDLLADLLMAADPKAYAVLFPVVERQAERTLPILQARLDKDDQPSETDPAHVEAGKDRLAERRARAAIALIRMGKPERVWPLLQHSLDPRLRSFIVNWLEPLGADPKTIVTELDRLDPSATDPAPPITTKRRGVLFHPETSMRRALILSLGRYGTEELPSSGRDQLTNKLLKLYRDDPDAGVHAAAEWTLRRWKHQEKLAILDEELKPMKDWGQRRWYVDGRGQTFAVIEGPVEFQMGSPPTEPEGDAESEPARPVKIPHGFAIATKEVTVGQFRQFLKAARFPVKKDIETAQGRYSSDPDGPWIAASWYAAAAYCNWLSQQEGLPKDQWCYQPKEGGSYEEGMTIPADVLKRTGYRLPTEAEWEYACRAGTVTTRYYGRSVELLGNYAWYLANDQDRARPCGSLLPNDLGLFDVLGNVYEWCQDPFGIDQPEQPGSVRDTSSRREVLIDKQPRVFRGGARSVSALEVRAAHRSADIPTYESAVAGFRPARTLVRGK
jgi:formylglycine-generating enzyme required for sulfatase activity